MIKHLYQTLSFAAWPVLRALPATRLRDGKEIKGRLHERFGLSSKPRPDGKLCWFHAASNGETLSAIPLITELLDKNKDLTILITTMTVTAAKLVEKRLGHDERIIHQFIPYDHPLWVSKFHNFWKPDMAVWVESELWPNHLLTLKKHEKPSVLVNARLSNKSVKRWFWAHDFFKNITSCFQTILAQTNRDKDNFEILGLENVQSVGNLKDMASALPFDMVAANDIRGVIEARPCILFASTHSPEEDVVRDVHQKLKEKYPDILSIIIPRHPKRGEEIANNLNKDGLNIARRSLKMSPRMDIDIYIADTLGETGLFYHLCPIVFIGNSMGTKPGGGHNLMEPAWFDCAIISGDDLHNFSIQADEMPSLNACVIIKNKDELATICDELLHNDTMRRDLQKNAYDYVQTKQSTGLGAIMDAIEPACKSAGIL